MTNTNIVYSSDTTPSSFTEHVGRSAGLYSPPQLLETGRSEDVLFGEIVVKILTSLPEGVDKDELKMDIQNRMLQTRMRLKSRTK